MIRNWLPLLKVQSVDPSVWSVLGWRIRHLYLCSIFGRANELTVFDGWNNCTIDSPAATAVSNRQIWHNFSG